MSIAEEYPVFVDEARKLDLLQTEVLYRRTDGQPSMKTRVKYVNGKREEVKEDKPMKSVHVIHLDDTCVLRVKRSNFERKQHLEFLLTLARETRFPCIHDVLQRVHGVVQGKNVIWKLNHDEIPVDYNSIKEYFEKLAWDAEEEKVAKENADLFAQPVIGDDQFLVAGWQA